MEYCRANGIEDVERFTDYLIRKAFTMEKYGDSPIPVKKAPTRKRKTAVTAKEKPAAEKKETEKKEPTTETTAVRRKKIKILKIDENGNEI